MKFLIPLLTLICAATSAFAQEKPAKLPDEPYFFTYEYDPEEISHVGIHLEGDAFVIFTADTRTSSDLKSYHFAYAIPRTADHDNGFEKALLLSQQINDAKKVIVKNPYQDATREERFFKIQDKTYLILGSLTFFK